MTPHTTDDPLTAMPDAAPAAEAMTSPSPVTDPVLTRLLAARPAYTTRYVRQHLLAQTREPAARPGGSGWQLLTGSEVRPQAGDVLLARVTEMGQHQRLESPESRRARLFVGDEVLVTCANRYAPDQFEAEVPAGLGPTQLVAAGGIAGDVLSASARMEEATRLEAIGLVQGPDGRRLRVEDHAPYAPAPHPVHDDGTTVPAVAVVGSAMNSGKSTVLAHLARGLAQAGLVVAAGKVTGTGAGGDVGLFADAGARHVLDFTDFGYASTYQCSEQEVLGLWRAMTTALRRLSPAPDVVLIEVADGIYQPETRALLGAAEFRAGVDGVVFAAGDSLGAAAGVSAVREAGLEVAAVSGLLTASPLLADEATAVLPVPVVATDSLLEPSVAGRFVGSRR